LEPLSGYLVLAQKLYEEGTSFADAWNFGPEEADAKPVQWIVEELCSQITNASWQCDASPNPHEANMLKLDSSKAKALLAWRPRWNLQTALHMTLAWHQAWKADADMADFSIEQIKQYEAASTST
jgi:CDP-glucose 4,6-dehydratase